MSSSPTSAQAFTIDQQMPLEPLPSRAVWTEHAACRPSLRPPHLTPAQWVGLWHPDGAIDPEARRRCLACPVRVVCLEASIDDNAQLPKGHQLKGIRAGIGGKVRKHILAQRRAQPDPHRYTAECDCTYCVAVAAALAGEAINRNSAGARCGYASTYSRGCHCPACTAAQVIADRVARCAEPVAA